MKNYKHMEDVQMPITPEHKPRRFNERPDWLPAFLSSGNNSSYV